DRDQAGVRSSRLPAQRQRHQGLLRTRPGRERRDRGGNLRPGDAAQLASSHDQPRAARPRLRSRLHASRRPVRHPRRRDFQFLRVRGDQRFAGVATGAVAATFAADYYSTIQRSAMKPLSRSLVAEFIGTLMFVFIGAGSVVTNAASGGGLGMIGIAMAHGVGLAVMVSATLNISGGVLNPAVAVGLLVAGKLDAKTTGLYVVAELLGAIVAAWLVKALLPTAAVQSVLIGTPGL